MSPTSLSAETLACCASCGDGKTRHNHELDGAPGLETQAQQHPLATYGKKRWVRKHGRKHINTGQTAHIAPRMVSARWTHRPRQHARHKAAAAPPIDCGARSKWRRERNGAEGANGERKTWQERAQNRQPPTPPPPTG